MKTTFAVVFAFVLATSYIPHRHLIRNRTRYVGEALQRYVAKHGRLPPREVVGPSGKYKHSWRVMLLPFLEIDDYRLDEPWDSEHNLAVVKRLDIMQIENEPSGMTPIVALYGPGTLWDESIWANTAPSLKQFWLGPFNSDLAPLLFVVSQDHLVPWGKPADLHVDRIEELFQIPDKPNRYDWDRGFLRQSYYGRAVFSARGDLHRLDYRDGDMVRRWTRFETYKQAQMDYFNQRTNQQQLNVSVFRYDNLFKLTVWLVLVVLPGVTIGLQRVRRWSTSAAKSNFEP